MYCKKCGKQIDDDAIFCPSCGTKVNGTDNSKSEEKGKMIESTDNDSSKCPNCGFNMRAFEVICPSCGFELRCSKRGTSRIEELSEKLQNETDVKKKKELIANFYVPNTREDIIEFFTLAASQISKDNEYIDAWCSKLEQTLMKAKLSLGQTSEYEYLDKLYKEANIKRKRIELFNHRFLILRIISTIIILIIGIIIFIFDMSNNKEEGLLFWTFFYAYFAFVAVFGIWASAIKSNKKKNKNNFEENEDEFDEDDDEDDN